MPSGLITLLTDFGTADAYVAILKGVVLGIDPDARIVDLSHAVPPQQIQVGALLLRSAVPFFPPETVHLVVVDPGVGSSRRPILIETANGILVGPDNGVLAPAATSMGRRTIRLIANQEFFRHPVSQTFHGRDIFAPVAAHLARGVAPDAFGPELAFIAELDLPEARGSGSTIAGEVLYADRFGNLVTNITLRAAQRFPARPVSVSIRATLVAGPVTAYTDVPEGSPLAIEGSWGTLEVAVRNGSAAEFFAAGPGTPVTVVLESRDA